MIMSLKGKLLKILIDGKIITDEQLKEALKEQKEKGGEP